MIAKSKPNIILFRELLLPASETFIVGQGEALRNFRSQYVGMVPVRGLQCPADRTHVMSSANPIGKIARTAFKYTNMDIGMGIMKKIQQLDPVLIHAHFGFGGMIAMPIAKQLDVPLFVTFHGYDATIHDNAYNPWFKSWIISRRGELQRKGAVFIAVSDYIRRKMIEQGYPEHKIVQHYIGIDLEKFTPSSQVERKPIVLFVGRLVEKKGAAYLIEAMSMVQKKLPEAKLVVIGEGPLREQLEMQCHDTLINYEFLGVQPPDKIKEMLNIAKVFSVPSIVAENGDAEGFGMVFAEAGAMGVPVVSFATGGIPEAVAHGETGLLAAEKDSGMLASYIKELLVDESLWCRFSENGKERVRRLFDVHKQSVLLEGIYAKQMTVGI